MKIQNESETIVLVGNWNKSILSPEWSAKNIFETTENIKVEFALGLGLPVRYTFSNIRLIPSDDRITFASLSHDDDNLQKMEGMALALIDKLPYTPINAVGINFGFEDDFDNKELLDLFKLSDLTPLSNFGCEIKGSAIRRTLLVEGKVINLNIAQFEDKILFDFNFHYDVLDATDVKGKIKDSIVRNKQIAETLLKDVYKTEYNKLEI